MEKDTLDEQLYALQGWLPKGDIRIVMGDLNVKVGSDNTFFWGGVGMYVGLPQRYVFGLPTENLPIVRELAWKHLSHYFGLASNSSTLRSVQIKEFFSPTGGEMRKENLVLATPCYTAPAPLEFYVLCNEKYPNVMRITAPPVNAPQHILDNVVWRKIPYV